MRRLAKTIAACSARLSYAAALRAIGQDLDRRGLKSVDLHVEENGYVAECGYQAPPSQSAVALRYTSTDLIELDAMGKERRGKMPAPAEFLNQTQILRTIGGYLDRNEARLLRVTNNFSSSDDASYKVEYITEEGERVVDAWSQSALYDLCVALYKQRFRMTGTGGERRVRSS